MVGPGTGGLLGDYVSGGARVRPPQKDVLKKRVRSALRRQLIKQEEPRQPAPLRRRDSETWSAFHERPMNSSGSPALEDSFDEKTVQSSLDVKAIHAAAMHEALQDPKRARTEESTETPTPRLLAPTPTGECA